MPKNAPKVIIGSGLILVILFNFVTTAMAQAAPPASKAVEACQALEPVFELPNKTAVKTALGFRQQFETSRNRYHAYTQCVFDEAVQEVYGSTGFNVDEIWTSNTPNFPDLLRPDATCLNPNVLTELAQSTSPKALLPAVLKVYNSYSEHLTALYDLHFQYGISQGRLESDYSSVKRMEHLVKNEIQDALVGLHTTLKMFNELRQIFIMHVHFQCMLYNLEDYRKLLSDLRKLIVLIPKRLIDASMTK